MRSTSIRNCRIIDISRASKLKAEKFWSVIVDLSRIAWPIDGDGTNHPRCFLQLGELWGKKKISGNRTTGIHLHRFHLLAGIEAVLLAPPRSDDVSFIAELVEKAINLTEWHEWAKQNGWMDGHSVHDSSTTFFHFLNTDARGSIPHEI